MVQQYLIGPSGCFVPWPKNLRIKLRDQIRVRLFERVRSPWGQPVGEWDFGPFNESIEGLDICLWRLDMHSVRVRTHEGSRLACTYDQARNPGVSERMALEVTLLSKNDAGWSQFQVELVAPPHELDATKRRFRLSQVPPIEWFLVELTNRCNFRCGWCPSGQMSRPRGAMPLDRAKALMEEIAAYRRQHPFFSLYAHVQNPVFLHVMGEPLLHPHFFEIIQHGHEHGLNFCLVTNASLIKGPVVRRLLDSGLNSIVLSLNAPDEASFSQAGAPLSYGRLVGQIQELVRQRYRRGSALPRLEIQLLNSKRVMWSASSLVERPDQVEAQLVFWSDFVKEQERATDVSSHAFDSADASRWQTVLERETNDWGIYFRLGENVSLTFKLACNFGNVLLPEHMGVRETSRGECLYRNAHRMLCVLWDGSGTFCSLDHDNEVNLGNVFEHGVEAIWTGERLSRIRGLLEHGVVSEALCRRCLGTVVPSGVG